MASSVCNRMAPTLRTDSGSRRLVEGDARSSGVHVTGHVTVQLV